MCFFPSCFLSWCACFIFWQCSHCKPDTDSFCQFCFPPPRWQEVKCLLVFSLTNTHTHTHTQKQTTHLPSWEARISTLLFILSSTAHPTYLPCSPVKPPDIPLNICPIPTNRCELARVMGLWWYIFFPSCVFLHLHLRHPVPPPVWRAFSFPADGCFNGFWDPPKGSCHVDVAQWKTEPSFTGVSPGALVLLNSIKEMLLSHGHALSFQMGKFLMLHIEQTHTHRRNVLYVVCVCVCVCKGELWVDTPRDFPITQLTLWWLIHQ